MSSPSIARANDLAKRAEHCRQTGQPRMAALYEKNLREVLQQVKVETRMEQIQANPLLVYKFLCEDIAEGIEAIMTVVNVLAEAVAEAVTTAQSTRQSDFVKVA